MTEAKDNSSLPLLLSISGAVLVVAVGGWFLLDQESSVPATAQNTRTSALSASMLTSAEDAPWETTEATVENKPDSDAATIPGDIASSDIEAELRKARLAADAEILVFPPAQSALYYYGRVLKTDPQHEIAKAELDAILSKVTQTVRQHIKAKEFKNAYEIAMLVAKQRPEHALVVETQRTLDEYTEQFIEQAIQHAQDGDDDQAVEVLAAAERLPGRNPDYFTAIRDSIAEIRDVRQAAERDNRQRARLAENEARAAWVGRIQSAIAEGKLISPAGASAIDLLAEPNSWAAQRDQLTGEVLSALVDTALSHIDSQRLNDAEALLNAAVELSGDPDGFEEVRTSLESALVEAKSNRIAQLTEMVSLKSVPPRYPRVAEEHNLSGWVELFFTVTPSGDTADIEVRRSEPESVFDRAAIEAVEKWEFQPVEYRGQLISQRVAARLVFRME